VKYTTYPAAPLKVAWRAWRAPVACRVPALRDTGPSEKRGEFGLRSLDPIIGGPAARPGPCRLCQCHRRRVAFSFNGARPWYNLL